MIRGQSGWFIAGCFAQGVLFVLLQHQFLSSHEEGEGEVPAKERKTLDLLSLVAINPLSGKSTLATRLYPPSAWSGRWVDGWRRSHTCIVVAAFVDTGLWSAGCVKWTSATAAWWVWVTTAASVCGSLGRVGPRGWWGPLRARAGSWHAGEEEARCWLAITTAMWLYTAAVVRFDFKKRTHTFIKSSLFLPLWLCSCKDFNRFRGVFYGKTLFWGFKLTCSGRILTFLQTETPEDTAYKHTGLLYFKTLGF